MYFLYSHVFGIYLASYLIKLAHNFTLRVMSNNVQNQKLVKISKKFQNKEVN